MTTLILNTLNHEVMVAHGDDAAAAGARLLTEGPALLPHAQGKPLEDFLRTAEHVLLGHLNQPEALLRLLPALQARAPSHAPLVVTLARTRLCLALAAGEAVETGTLPVAEQVRAHYNAALARGRQGDWAGMQALVDAANQRAQAVATAPAEAGAPDAQRALAALTNNIASDLRQALPEGAGRDAALGVMLSAAALARQAWARAGGWLEIERADWQLAMCHAAAGGGQAARHHAQAALQACETHAADDYEFCFAWQAVALAAVAEGALTAALDAREQMAQRIDALAQAEADHHHAVDCLATLDAAIAELPGASRPVAGDG